MCPSSVCSQFDSSFLNVTYIAWYFYASFTITLPSSSNEILHVLEFFQGVLSMIVSMPMTNPFYMLLINAIKIES